ncbi:hypothetical protein KW805_04905 [Candidatus Pacearchaeota archaeon]|nr:hypothetical protein [Candidatus Pacearchaeota archaeon]
MMPEMREARRAYLGNAGSPIKTPYYLGLTLGNEFEIMPGRSVRVSIPGIAPFELHKMSTIPNRGNPSDFRSILKVDTQATAYLSWSTDNAFSKNPDTSFVRLYMQKNNMIYFGVEGHPPIFVENLSRKVKQNEVALAVVAPRNYFFVDSRFAKRDPSFNLEEYLVQRKYAPLTNGDISYLQEIKRKLQMQK